jgi:hypothetical protein
MCVLDGPVIEQQQHGGEAVAAGQLLSLRPLHAAQDQALGGASLPSTRGLSITAYESRFRRLYMKKFRSSTVP